MPGPNPFVRGLCSMLSRTLDGYVPEIQEAMLAEVQLEKRIQEDTCAPAAMATPRKTAYALRPAKQALAFLQS